MKTIFCEDNVANDMVVEFTAAIRFDPTYLVDGYIANDTMYACPDEGFACPGTTIVDDNVTNYVTCGCPYTAWVECAMNSSVSQNQKVNFVTCWDDASIADKVQNDSTLEVMAESCAIEASLDWAKVQACHVGPQKSDLLWLAANKFMNKWPDYTTMGGPYHVPHVLISSVSNATDTEDMEDINLESADITYFNHRLCALGIEMPACSLFNISEVIA